MNQSLNNLEINVYQLVQKFETLVSENRRLNEEIDRLKLEQEQQKRQHDAAIDELSEALLVQVGKLKEDLQSKIDSLTVEKENYRNALAQSADQIRSLIARLPQNTTIKGCPVSIEQVNLDIMNVNFTINTPSEEKATLLQAVEMLNKKSDAIKESGRIVGTDKIVVMAALNVVHDLLKTTLNDDLAIGEFERKITDMNNACQKALARLEQN